MDKPTNTFNVLLEYLLSFSGPRILLGEKLFKFAFCYETLFLHSAQV